jgi:hypothetical protein
LATRVEAAATPERSSTNTPPQPPHRTTRESIPTPICSLSSFLSNHLVHANAANRTRVRERSCSKMCSFFGECHSQKISKHAYNLNINLFSIVYLHY